MARHDCRWKIKQTNTHSLVQIMMEELKKQNKKYQSQIGSGGGGAVNEEMIEKTKQLEAELEDKRQHEAVSSRVGVGRVHAIMDVRFANSFSFWAGTSQTGRGGCQATR